jgi:hypothetical protein
MPPVDAAENVIAGPSSGCSSSGVVGSSSKRGMKMSTFCSWPLEIGANGAPKANPLRKPAAV